MSGEKKDRLSEDMHDEGRPEEEDHGMIGAEEVEEVSIEKLLKENEELTNQMLYLRAELDNFKKRTSKEKEQLVAYGNERLIKALIPVLDNLELGMIHGKEDDEARQFLSGVELTYNDFLNILKKFGVVQLDAKDDIFDPNVHEAVSSIADPAKEPGTIYQVVRKGYILNDRLLRPVQVVVVTEPHQNDEEDGDPRDKSLN